MLPTAALDFNVAIPSLLQSFARTVFDVVIDDEIQLLLGEAVVFWPECYRLRRISFCSSVGKIAYISCAFHPSYFRFAKLRIFLIQLNILRIIRQV